MRTILFRGQKADTKEWIFGDLIQLEKDFKKVVEILDWSKVDNKKKSKSDLTVIQETVGQFTGLTDKNGIKIFEGDIYHQGDKNITYTVVWNDCGIIGKQNGTSSFAGINYWLDRIEVVGNIHDNPELLR